MLVWRMGFGQTCAALNVPYVEDFSNINMSCTKTQYTTNNGIPYLWSICGSDPGLCIFGASGSTNAEQWFMLQGVNLIAGKTYTIRFNYVSQRVNAFKLCVGDNQDMSSMNTIIYQTNNIRCYSGVVEQEYTPSTSGVYYFGFCCYYLADGKILKLDNFSIEETSCFRPIKQPVTNVTNVSARLNWLPNMQTNVLKDVYYSTVGPCITGSQIALDSTLNDSITLKGLTPGTKYYYSIRSHCNSNNKSAWTTVDSFTTDCNPASIPYQINLTATNNDLPPCTSSEKFLPFGSDWYVSYFSSGYIGFYNGFLILQSNQNQSSDACFYTQKMYMKGGKTYKLSFKFGSSNIISTERLEVRYGNSTNFQLMTGLILNYPDIQTDTSMISTVEFTPLDSGFYNLGFRGYSSTPSGYGNLLIGDITVTDQYTLVVNTFLDKNTNGIKDAGENIFSNATILTQKNGVGNIVSVSSGGSVIVNIDTGTYQTSVIPYMPYFTTVPLYHTTTNTGYLQLDTATFAVQPISGKRDLTLHIIPITTAIQGSNAVYKISYRNQGTDTILSGTVEMIKDSRCSFISSIPSPTSISGDTLRWVFANLQPLDSAGIDLNLQLQPPPALYLGDFITYSASVLSEKTDLTPSDNFTFLNQLVRGSYDPNDKTESHGGSIEKSKVDNGEYLQYTIHFQNIGSDTAFNITIKDTLDSKLDWSTFRMLDASHNYQLTINEDNKCEWKFNNINLPYSTINEPLSHGYITFIIKAKSSVVVGNIITNKAVIYFDYNLLVVTNLEKTTVVADVLPLQLLSFTARQDGKINHLQWTTAKEVNVDHFEIERSSNGRAFEKIENVKLKVESGGSHTYNYYDRVNYQLSTHFTIA